MFGKEIEPIRLVQPLLEFVLRFRLKIIENLKFMSVISQEIDN
jgi:hypothetical protein